jgi:sugar lactone lactonase YvrE
VERYPPAPKRRGRAIRVRTQHLYVADPGSGAIYRYALVDGLPKTKPDEVFARLPDVRFLGVDSAGNISAAGRASAGGGFVQVFSPAGKLLGKAQLGVPIAAFAVGLAGYMYV